MTKILVLILGCMLGAIAVPSTLVVASSGGLDQDTVTSSKMTNAEVIQLATAGLSDQVITALIRQTAKVEFDLSPTGLVALKKAGVSDAIIVVMQEKSYAPQPPSTAQAKVPTEPDSSLAGLARSIDSGQAVNLRVKYNSVCPTCPGIRRLFAMTPMQAVYMADGVLTLTKTSIAFKGTVGAYDFNISPDKIIQLDDQPEQSSRMHMKVALLNRKGREDIKDFYFYNSAAQGTGDPTVGGSGQSIICPGCDDSMHYAFKLLSSLRSK